MEEREIKMGLGVRENSRDILLVQGRVNICGCFDKDLYVMELVGVRE
jgi:hypothetical protein